MTYSREFLKRTFEEKICVECGSLFYVRKEGRCRSKGTAILRQRGSKTCSKKCSKALAKKTSDEAYLKYYKNRNKKK